jgi:hypothetical protein
MTVNRIEFNRYLNFDSIFTKSQWCIHRMNYETQYTDYEILRGESYEERL